MMINPENGKGCRQCNDDDGLLTGKTMVIEKGEEVAVGGLLPSSGASGC
jgi:hypothetical protein